MRLRADGRVLVELKTVWRDGPSHLLFEPIECRAKLAAIIPCPAILAVVDHGARAPPARWRSRVVRDGPPAPALTAHAGDARPRGAGPPGAGRWATLLRRVCAVDVLPCPRGGRRLRVIAPVQDPLAGQAPPRPPRPRPRAARPRPTRARCPHVTGGVPCLSSPRPRSRLRRCPAAPLCPLPAHALPSPSSPGGSRGPHAIARAPLPRRAPRAAPHAAHSRLPRGLAREIRSCVAFPMRSSSFRSSRLLRRADSRPPSKTSTAASKPRSGRASTTIRSPPSRNAPAAMSAPTASGPAHASKALPRDVRSRPRGNRTCRLGPKGS